MQPGIYVSFVLCAANLCRHPGKNLLASLGLGCATNILMEIHFFGAAGTVTGSKTLLQAGEQKILVDCGLYQGLKDLRLRNRAPLPFAAAAIDRVLLTHAHLDHSGALPLLLQAGYRGKIFCTPPTRDLLRILLLDFAHLEEEDAKHANRHGYSRHHPALPLYEQEDVMRTLRQVEVISEGEWHDWGGGLRLRMHENGHILGSCAAEFHFGRSTVLFSGDLGRPDPLLIRPPRPAPAADVVVLESTYGDRLHETQPPMEALAEVLQRVRGRGGKVLVPSFAVGRAQDLMFLLERLFSSGKVPRMPVYLDSPMAIEVTEVFFKHRDWLRVSEKDAREIFRHVHLVRETEASSALRHSREPAVIIAGSGMAAGGRILGHLEDGMGDPRNAILLVGFQSPGTRGRNLQEGATEIKMHGHYYPVRAEVVKIGSLSAHADQHELIEWVKGAGGRPRVFLVHGEPQAADALRVRVEHDLGLAAEVAEFGMVRSLPD
jgi:metallo-beta-lactamase family protein